MRKMGKTVQEESSGTPTGTLSTVAICGESWELWQGDLSQQQWDKTGNRTADMHQPAITCQSLQPVVSFSTDVVTLSLFFLTFLKTSITISFLFTYSWTSLEHSTDCGSLPKSPSVLRQGSTAGALPSASFGGAEGALCQGLLLGCWILRMFTSGCSFFPTDFVPWIAARSVRILPWLPWNRRIGNWWSRKEFTKSLWTSILTSFNIFQHISTYLKCTFQ